MIARLRAWPPGTGQRCRAMPGGGRPRTGLTRWPCCRSRTPTGSRTWCRSVMAEDLKDTPVAGLQAQLCGDAHLSNFGLFASPERILLFDVNDFDETLPGPVEYDVERMSASFTVAGRGEGLSPADVRTATLASVRAYREAMASFAQLGTMDVWYARLDED